MLSPPDVWTRELVLALPDDGNRYELIDGELLVTASPDPSLGTLVIDLRTCFREVWGEG